MTLTRRLARLRVPLGFGFGVLCVWLARPSPSTWIAGAIVALGGEAIRIWAAGHLEKNLGVTTTGPYRWTRHPLYVGSTVMGAGLVIAAARVDVAALVALYLVTTFTAAVRTEERFLEERFGERYVRYRNGEADADSRRFSWARALGNREYRALLGLTVVMGLLAWKAWAAAPPV